MDKGIAGWDTDAVGTWHHLDLPTLRRYTGYVIGRGGFVSAENMVLLDEVTRSGGFNAGTGFLRHEFYNELKAITEHRADHIREALKVRQQLIGLGMFPYQQFGDQSHGVLTGGWFSHVHEMFKLQVAFNAVLPDQVWILAPRGSEWRDLRPRHDRLGRDPETGVGYRLRALSRAADVPAPGTTQGAGDRAHRGDADRFSPGCVRGLQDLRGPRAQRPVVFNFSESYRAVVVTLGDRGLASLGLDTEPGHERDSCR